MKIGNGLIIMQINFFILNRSLKTLHKDIIKDSASTIHTDPDLRLFQTSDEIRNGKLDSLVGIENLRFGNPQSLLKSLEAKRSL